MSGTTLWRIGTDTPSYVAEDPGGIGAEKTGGRWNAVGTPMVYTSTTIALAALETLVHLDAKTPLPLNRYLVRIDVPETVWAAATNLPITIGWDARPAGQVSINAGTKWCSSKAALLCTVPSVVVPEESNVLVNPRHPDAHLLTFTKVRLWQYDPRAKA